MAPVIIVQRHGLPADTEFVTKLTQRAGIKAGQHDIAIVITQEAGARHGNGGAFCRAQCNHTEFAALRLQYVTDTADIFAADAIGDQQQAGFVHACIGGQLLCQLNGFIRAAAGAGHNKGGQ